MSGNQCYCVSERRMINVKFGVLAVLADRPEKASIMKTSLLGSYGKIASWASDINPNVLPDCRKCFEQHSEKIIECRHWSSQMKSCRNCCQWDLKSSSASLKRLCIPEKYPNKSATNAPQPSLGRGIQEKYLIPVRQTFKFLIAAVVFASYNGAEGVWTKRVMDVYLRTCVVAQSVRD